MRFIVLCTLFLFVNAIYAQDLVPYRDKQLWGYADQTGKIIIQPQYEKAFPFWKNGLAKVMKGENFILINAKNEVKTQEQYSEIFEFKNGMAAVCKGGKFSVMQGEIVGGSWGYINETNFSEVIPLTYARAESFNGNYAIVQKDGNWGNWGVIDKTGKIILPFNYTTYSFDMRPFPGIIWHDNSTKLEIDLSGSGNKWNLIDITGKKLSGPVSNYHGMNDIYAPDKAYEALKKAEKNKEDKIREANYIIKTPSGDLTCSGDVTAIAPGIYIADRFDENRKSKFGVIDENNKILVSFEYDNISTRISEGMIAVSKNQRYGFCDLNGQEVIPCKYPMADEFNNGIARVYLTTNYSFNTSGYINKEGIEFFKSDPIYQVNYKDGKYTVTDQYDNPKWLQDSDFDFVEIINEKYFLTRKSNYFKLFNPNGEFMISGTEIIKSTHNCVLVSTDDPDNQRGKILLDLLTGAILVDSIDHTTSTISDPKTLKPFGYTYINKKGLYGLFTLTDKALIPANYQFIQFTGAYFILTNTKNKFAICDTNYQFIRDFSSDNISFLTQNLFSVQNKSMNEVYDARTKKLSNYKLKINKWPNYVTAGVIENSKKQFGYINPNTEEILEPFYTDITPIKMYDANFLPADLIMFKKTTGKYDIYNRLTGKIIITDCDGQKEVQGRWLPVKFANKYTFYDNNGQKAFEDTYDDLHSVKAEGNTAVKLNGKWGIIDRQNNIISKFNYEYVDEMIDNLIVFTKDDKCGIALTEDGADSVIIPEQYQSIEYISQQTTDSTETEYFFVAEKENKKGIINQKNKIIAPFYLDGETDFSFNEDVFVISKNKKPALFNSNGKIIIDGDFDYIGPSNAYDREGHEYVDVSKEKKHGLYKITGEKVLDCIYDEIANNDEMYEGNDMMYYTFKKDKKTGLLSSTGEIIIPPVCEKFDAMYGDNASYLRTKENVQYFLYKNYRKKLSQQGFDYIDLSEESVAQNVFIVNSKGKYGLLDTSGKLVVPAIYSKIEPGNFDNDLILFKTVLNGKNGIVSNTGQTIVPAEFDKIEIIYDIDNLGFYTWKGKLLGVYGFNGKQIAENKFTKFEYSDDDAYLLFFVTKNNEYWGLTPTFELIKLNR